MATTAPVKSPDIQRLRASAATSSWRLAWKRIVDTFWAVFAP